jgi:hypothetical protein
MVHGNDSFHEFTHQTLAGMRDVEQTGKKCSTVLPDGPLHDLCPANQAKSKPTE